MRPPTAQIDRFWASDWSLTTLLAFLCLTIFVLRPLETLGYDVRMLASVVFSVILISGIFAVSHSPRLRIIFATVAVISILVRWLRFAIFGSDWLIAETCGAVVAFGMLATIVLLQVFREGPVAETRDLDENTLLDVDSQGEHLCHHRRACLGADRNSGTLLRADPELTFAARNGDCGLVVFGAKVISPTVDERIEILEAGLERNLEKGWRPQVDSTPFPGCADTWRRDE